MIIMIKLQNMKPKDPNQPINEKYVFNDVNTFPSKNK